MLFRSNVQKLSAANKATIKRVLQFYADKDAQWLSDLTHMEEPWKQAFAKGVNTEILPQDLSEYYSTLSADVEA